MKNIKLNTQNPQDYDCDFLLFKTGNEKVFEGIFKTRYNHIVGFCLQFVYDHDKAKSIAQEAFIKLWLNRSKIQKVNGINAFLYTAAKTECLNYLRHEKIINNYNNRKRINKEIDLNRDVLESFDFNTIEYTELEEIIKKAIDELPEKCRLVFVKSRLEGKKNKEIALELGIAIKSVENNMTRALKAMRKKLSGIVMVLIMSL